MRTLLAILAAAALLCSGCSSMNAWGTKVPMGGKTYPAVEPDQVMILFTPPAKAYDEIGLVSSIGGLFASDADMFKKMQKEAAEIGADAIIVRPGADGAGVSKNGIYPKTSAVAIKYRPE